MRYNEYFKLRFLLYCIAHAATVSRSHRQLLHLLSIRQEISHYGNNQYRSINQEHFRSQQAAPSMPFRLLCRDTMLWIIPSNKDLDGADIFSYERIHEDSIEYRLIHEALPFVGKPFSRSKSPGVSANPFIFFSRFVISTPGFSKIFASIGISMPWDFNWRLYISDIILKLFFPGMITLTGKSRRSPDEMHGQYYYAPSGQSGYIWWSARLRREVEINFEKHHLSA